MYGGKIVERGPAEEVTQHPAHPYTQLLIASAPDPDNLGSVAQVHAAPTGSVAARTTAAGTVGPAAVGCPFSPVARSPSTSAGQTTRPFNC